VSRVSGVCSSRVVYEDGDPALDGEVVDAMSEYALGYVE